jgi:hypothetical protein
LLAFRRILDNVTYFAPAVRAALRTQAGIFDRGRQSAKLRAMSGRKRIGIIGLGMTEPRTPARPAEHPRARAPVARERNA